jgi:phytoene/squalene synthetase
VKRREDGLALYTTVAGHSAGQVIGAYSTSFAWASRLFAEPTRGHVRNIYALVRIADEVVDGPGAEAGLSAAARRDTLADLERDTARALDTGYSANLAVHAFAVTARRTGFGTELTEPFFAAMSRDLEPVDFTGAELADYIYGSAEVVGLMCLHTFAERDHVDPVCWARWEEGARHLGAAFQKVNFLRDLGEDYYQRKRRYFPDIDPDRLTEADKTALLADIRADLDAAAAVIPELPAGSRRAVAAAHGLFAALCEAIRRTPAADLARQRVSVPSKDKALVLLRAAGRGGAVGFDRATEAAL